jgi:RHS repeat-associated protein
MSHPASSNFSDVFATTTDRYQYSGKELDRMNGLDLYDFHARQYDPVLGRFTTPDPLSEKYYHISPYAYCANNPINAIDPNGMNPIYDINGNFLGTDDKGIAGSYVIMNKNDFVQGMSHKSALEKQYLNAIENDARQKIWDHHATLDT